MNNYLWILFFVILGLDLLFSIVRSSLLNSRPMQLIGMREMDPKGVELALSVLEKKRLRVSLRISMILMHFIISAFIYFIFISLFPQMAIWFVFGMVILAAFLLLLVEFALEGLVLHAPEKWAIRIAWLGDVMRFVFSPVAALMMALLGSSENLQQRLGPVTEEEIRTWVNTDQGESGLEKDEREMIYSIFQFGETLCREIMVPRIDITGLEVSATVQEAIDAFTKSGHSRVPVYEETIDDIIGLLYAKDLLRTDLTEKEKTEVRPFLRKAYFIPESKNVDELLREMQAQGVHMAIVVDEYGGTAGLVTLEDIVEEIVGEIRDEYDQAEELEFQQMSEDEVVFSGRIDLDDVYDILGVDLTEDMADTLGGYIYGQIGRVPVGGEQIKVDGWLLTVSQVSGRRIRKVLAKRVGHISETEQSNAD
ncbi:MAG: HlyC/CorC family transporter [Anaerolineaceae bacterium]|nr:HlyC/CorC family transporter [Anaerolineaceae bacterium]